MLSGVATRSAARQAREGSESLVIRQLAEARMARIVRSAALRAVTSR